MTPKPVNLVRRGREPDVPVGATERARGDRSVLPTAVHLLVPLVIAGCWALSLGAFDLRAMTDVGLVSVTPVSALALLALLTASFCLELRSRPPRPWVAAVHLVVLIVMLYGVTAFIEQNARFSSVYRHVGIIDTIIRHGDVDPSIDAYFNWPGFFALGAMLSEAAGLHGALGMAPWGALVFNALFVAPLLVIFRWASDDPRVWWLGLWVFFSANWVGQDYLSPQAVAYTLWLAMLAALLTWFTPRPAILAERPSLRWAAGLLDLRRLRGRLRAERTAAARDGGARRPAGLVLTIVAIFAAIVSGHQLTPFAIVLAVGALTLFAGLETRRLPMLMVVLLGAWISYQTTSFLIGHIQDLSGPVGSTSDNLTKNVSSRVGGSAGHSFVVTVRLVGSVAIWLLAAAGFARRIATRRADVAFVLLGITPFVLPILQPYGGEMVLRVFLFVLPVAAFFIACLAFPTERHGRGWPTTVGVLALCLVLLALFEVMRYGNERFDYYTPGDVAAVDAVYRDAAPGATLYGGNLPWRHVGYADYDYRSIITLDAWRTARDPSPTALVAEIARKSPPAGAYVVVTRSMEIEAEMFAGKPGVLDRVAAALRATPTARELFAGGDGAVFHVAHVSAGPTAGKAAPRRPTAAAKPTRRAAAKPSRRAARAPARVAPVPRQVAPAPPPVAPTLPIRPVTPPPAAVAPPPPPPPPARPATPPPPPPSSSSIFDDSG